VASYNELFGLGSHSEDANLGRWYPCQDDAASTAVDDASSNASDGTLNGGNTADKATTGPNSWLASALDFDGNDDVAFTPPFSAGTQTALTVLARARNDSGGGNQDHLLQLRSLSGSTFLQIRKTDFGTVLDARLSINGSSNTITGTTNVVSGNWEAIAYRRDGDDHDLQLDGTVEDSDTHSLGTHSVSANTSHFGNWTAGGVVGWIGPVADVAIFSRALTDAEIDDWVSGPEPVNSVAPAVSGTETVGETLSVTTGTWGLDAPFSAGSNGTITYSYQWTRSDDASGTGEADIGSATSNTYTLVTADVGKFIRCRVRATNDGGFDSAADTNSDFTGEIQAASTGEVTATAALTIGAATLSGSATHTAPSFTAEAELTAPAATLAGSAEFDAPVFTATAALDAPAATLAGSATFATETFTGSAALDVGAATFAGSATFEDPVFTGEPDLTAPAATLSGSAEFDAPVFTGSASLTVGAATLAGSAGSIGFEATATLTVGAATFSGSATFTADTGVNIPGLEYALPVARTHYVLPEQLLDYELPLGRLHYVWSEEP
jgi:hypothetical protein